MPLIAAKCTNCGGVLEVDASKDAAICPHCGSAFITEKAINNYNTYQNTYNQIHADTIIMQDASMKEFDVVGGILKAYRGENLDLIIPENVFEIGDNCFENMYIRSVVLPKGLKRIGESAFAHCVNLEKIDLPEGLQQIKKEAFFACTSLKQLVIPDGCQIDDSVWGKCENLERVVLPKGLKCITAFLFGHCRKLQEICIPDTVESIGSSAFALCTGLRRVVTNAPIEFIGYSAFYMCSSLTEFPILNSLKCIDTEAFKGCTQLRNFPLPDGMERLGGGAFENCSSLQLIRLSESVTIYEDAFKGCSSLSRVISERYAPEKLTSDSNPFKDTPIQEQIIRRETQRRWVAFGLCPDCGGEPVGFLRKKCNKCGRPM